MEELHKKDRLSRLDAEPSLAREQDADAAVKQLVEVGKRTLVAMDPDAEVPARPGAQSRVRHEKADRQRKKARAATKSQAPASLDPLVETVQQIVESAIHTAFDKAGNGLDTKLARTFQLAIADAKSQLSSLVAA